MSYPYDLTEMQTDHRRFVVKMGWANTKTPLESVALIHEECTELGREFRRREFDKEAAAAEMADIILRTIDLAAELGINIQQAVIDKINYNFEHIDEYKAKKDRKV